MDIVERLRAPVDDGTPITVCHLLDEAAYRIESLSARIAALEGALRGIAADSFVPLSECPDHDQPNGWRKLACERIDIARRALATTGEGDGE